MQYNYAKCLERHKYNSDKIVGYKLQFMNLQDLTVYDVAVVTPEELKWAMMNGMFISNLMLTSDNRLIVRGSAAPPADVIVPHSSGIKFSYSVHDKHSAPRIKNKNVRKLTFEPENLTETDTAVLNPQFKYIVDNINKHYKEKLRPKNEYDTDVKQYDCRFAVKNNVLLLYYIFAVYRDNGYTNHSYGGKAAIRLSSNNICDTVYCMHDRMWGEHNGEDYDGGEDFSNEAAFKQITPDDVIYILLNSTVVKQPLVAPNSKSCAHYLEGTIAQSARLKKKNA